MGIGRLGSLFAFCNANVTTLKKSSITHLFSDTSMVRSKMSRLGSNRDANFVTKQIKQFKKMFSS